LDRLALAQNTILDGSYRILREVGSGGFGITYEAEDLNLFTRIAIKEYYPFDFADRDTTLSVRPRSERHKKTFQWGRTNFLQEARTLAQFEHPAIVRVSRVFEANSTAYMVMRFEQGLNLEHWLRQLGRPPTQQELDAIMRPLLEALQMMHRANFLHRDISPDNIIVRDDGSPVLLDFGAARRAVAEMSHSLTGIVKPGYSPHEQYTSDSRLQGPWTDLYALGGTLYRAVAGVPPEEATLRVDEDRMPPAIQIAQGKYRKEFLSAIDACLKVRGSERPQSVTEVRSRLLGDQSQPKSGLAPVSRPVTKPQQPSRRISTAWRKSSNRRLAPAIVAAIVAVSGGVYGAFEFSRWQSEQQSTWKTRQRVAEAAQRQASLEADRRLKDEQARTAAEEQRRAEEAQRQAAEDARREVEREAQRRQAEEQERARAAAEAQRRAEEAQRQAAEDARREVEREAQRQQAEEQERARTVAEAQRRAEEAQRKAAEDAQQGAEREAQRRQAEEQERARKAAQEREADARRRAEAEARAAEEARRAELELRRVQAEEERARRQTRDRIAGAEQKERQRLATAPSDGERTAFVRRIQRVLQKASCYDGALNGRSEDAQKALNRMIESSKGPRKPARIELAKATIGDFESWLRSADEIIDGEICPPPKPSSPPARHQTSTSRHRDEGVSRGSRQPGPRITRETRPAREWGAYSGGSSGGVSVIQGVRP
jgi:serine/threonine protein kinase